MSEGYRKFETSLASVCEGDLLLYRSSGLIAHAGRGEWSHAAKVSLWEGVPFVVEVREWHGGRATTLARQVARNSGRIDVFTTNTEDRWPLYNRQDASNYMRELAGCHYGYSSVLRASFMHLPFLRCFLSPNTNDKQNTKSPPFCSQAIAQAERAGGVDPVPHLADRLTEPSDLARSPFYNYRFTLVCDTPKQ